MKASSSEYDYNIQILFYIFLNVILNKISYPEIDT